MRERLKYLEGIMPFLFALGCARAWVTLTVVSPSSMLFEGFDFHNVFDYAYCVLALAMALGARKLAPLSVRKRYHVLSYVLMTIASLCCVATQFAPQAALVLTLAAAVLGGAGFCLFLLLWAETIACLSLLRIFLYTTSSLVVGVVCVFFCQGFDNLRSCLAILLLPAIAVACLAHAYGKLPAEARPKKVTARFSYPWKLFVLFALYSFAYGLREQQLVAGAGAHSSLSTALVMTVLFVVALAFSDHLNVAALYHSPLALMVCGFLLIPAESMLGATASSYLIAMSYSLMSVLVSLLLYDISKRMGVAVMLYAGVKAAEQIFVVWGKAASLALSSAVPDVAITALVAALVLASTLILFSERELASKWGVTILDAGSLVERSREEERLDASCTALTQRYRLSPREDEILRLIAQGKTGSVIQKELFIAEGTFKAHTRHIYEKMGINSRKELKALIEAGAGGGAQLAEAPANE